MYECVDFENKLYTVDNYCILKKENKHPEKIFCPICNNNLYVKAENSQRKTHFCHFKNSSCIILDYSDLFKSNKPKKSNEEILNIKQDIFKLSYSIYNCIKNIFAINLPIHLFLEILQEIIDNKILSFSGFKIELLPYIFINVLGEYNNVLYYYTNSTLIKDNLLWNIGSKKDIILCIDKSSTKVTTKTIYIDTSILSKYNQKITISFLKEIIDLNFFDILNLSNEYDSLKILLNTINDA